VASRWDAPQKRRSRADAGRAGGGRQRGKVPAAECEAVRRVVVPGADGGFGEERGGQRGVQRQCRDEAVQVGRERAAGSEAARRGDVARIHHVRLRSCRGEQRREEDDRQEREQGGIHGAAKLTPSHCEREQGARGNRGPIS
jgi:hypothetical protein